VAVKIASATRKTIKNQVRSRGSALLVDPELVDTGLVDTGLVDTGLVDTGLVDTGLVDTELDASLTAGRGDAEPAAGHAASSRLASSKPCHRPRSNRGQR